MNLRIELTEAEANAVLGVVGPAVSAMRSPEGTALYEAERKIDGALLAAEQVSPRGGKEQERRRRVWGERTSRSEYRIEAHR